MLNNYGSQFTRLPYTFQAETNKLYKKIAEFEDATKESNGISDKYDADIRDMGKKVQKFESNLEETIEKLQGSASKMDEAEKEFKDKEEDVNAQSRRVLLLEEESRISVEKLANTILKLALMSKDADNIVKSCRHWESKTMNNEVEIEELDVNTREARRIGKTTIYISKAVCMKQRIHKRIGSKTYLKF